MYSIMEQILIIAVLLSSLCILTFSQNTATGVVDDPEQQVQDAVARFGDAFVAADVAVLELLLSDDYIHTNSTGSVLNKQQWLEYIKSRRADLESGRLKMESYKNTDLRIRVYEEAAIVTGTNVAKGKREDKQFVTELRFTHLWVRQRGQWKRAAFHDSAITK